MCLTYVEFAWHVSCYLSLTIALATKKARTTMLSHEFCKGSGTQVMTCFTRVAVLTRNGITLWAPEIRPYVLWNVSAISFFNSVSFFVNKSENIVALGENKRLATSLAIRKVPLKSKILQNIFYPLFCLIFSSLKNKNKNKKLGYYFFSERFYLLFLLKLLCWQTIK